MSEPAMSGAAIGDKGPERRIGRSILAVVVGMIAGIILSLATDEVLHVLHVFPPWDQPAGSGPLLLATIYRTIYGVATSYITARLAPGRPMLHAMILGTIGFAVSILGAVLTWNKGPQFGPHWYPAALVVLALPTAWLGARIRVTQMTKLAGRP